MNIEITEFLMSDYEEAKAFWASIPEVGLDDADSISSMEAFLKRNPGLSFVAKHGKDLIWTAIHFYGCVLKFLLAYTLANSVTPMRANSFSHDITTQENICIFAPRGNPC